MKNEVEPSRDGYSRRIVSLEGRLELEKQRTTCDIGHEFLTGLAWREYGAANVANVERDLFLLNGKNVRVTIEWRESSAQPENDSKTQNVESHSPASSPESSSPSSEIPTVEPEDKK